MDKVKKAFGNISIVLKCGIALLVIAVLVKYIAVPLFGAKDISKDIKTSSSLTDVADIAELYTAEYYFSGIAPYYDEDDEEASQYIKYVATVKAELDTNNITLSWDTKNKVVSIGLPEITYEPIIDDSEGFVFANDKNLDIDEVLRACKEDVLNKSLNSSEFVSVAEENAKNVIEGFIYPLVKAEGYTISWESEVSEG